MAELRGAPLVGSLPAVLGDRLAFVEAARAAGDVTRFRLPRRRLYLVNDPAHVRTVLVDRADAYDKGIGLEQARPLLGNGLLTSGGERWRRQRACAEPAFERSRVQACAPVIEQAVGEMLARWARATGPVDLSAEIRTLSLDVFLRTFFATEARGSSEAVGRAIAAVLRDAMRRMTLPVALPTPGALRARRALRLLERHARAIAAAPGDGLLSAAVAADDEPRDALLTFLVAGHETTAAALTWTLHLVATRPEALAAAREGEEGRRRVVREALRLYPPVWLIPRRATRDEAIGGHSVPAGADVLVSPYALHRSPRFWERPAEPMLGRAPAPGAYLPFGLGPHACVGASFARLEMDLVLAMVVERFRLAPATTGEPRPQPLLTLRPPEPFPFAVRPAT